MLGKSILQIFAYHTCHTTIAVDGTEYPRIPHSTSTRQILHMNDWYIARIFDATGIFQICLAPRPFQVLTLFFLHHKTGLKYGVHLVL
jgi:hypothetical protein